MRLHHVALRTRELPRLEEFYVRVLGLTVTRRDGVRGVWLDAGGVTVMLERADTDEPPVAAGSKELVAFAIEAGEGPAWEDRLARAGIKVEARTEATLYVRDPDGRKVGVSAWPKGLAG